MAGINRELTARATALDEGDAVEVAVTLSRDYQSVKYGVTIHQRAEETVRQTKERAEDFVIGNAQRLLDEICGD